MAHWGPQLIFCHKCFQTKDFGLRTRLVKWGRMGLSLWHKGTLRAGVIVLTIAFGELALFGQTSPDWRKVGGSAVEVTLAAPATGAVDQVWFSPQGSVLFARTHS